MPTTQGSHYNYFRAVLGNDVDASNIWDKRFFEIFFNEDGPLNDSQREVMELRYGAEMTLKQVAEKRGVTSERIRQICARACRRMRMVKKEYWLPDIMKTVDDLKKENREMADVINAQNEILENFGKKRIAPESFKYITFEQLLADGDINVRIYNCLKRMGYHVDYTGDGRRIKTLGDLTNFTRKEILNTRNMGEKNILILDKAMEKYGLEYKEDLK